MPQSQPPSLRKRFQSTPSVGRATITSRDTTDKQTPISIHALRGEGDKSLCRPYSRQNISIHALRGEGDLPSSVSSSAMISYFNPRPPWGGRQIQPPEQRDPFSISIHALRGEGDHIGAVQLRQTVISIHALRGEGDIIAYGMD